MLLPHIDALASHAPPDTDTDTTAYLLNQAGLFLNNQGQPGGAAGHFQRALADDLGLSGLDAGELQARFLTRTADEWVTWARERNLPLVKIVL